jgi:gamma-glutamyltranspeptidase/glutathione hydrolase
MAFDFQKQRYASRRTVAFAKNGMCATSGPLPAQAGLDVLRRGGTAADAAVAMAAVLAVTEPTSNGLGSDAFALVWSKGKLYGLNASGSAPALLSLPLLRSRGYERMPMRGWETVMVPGAPAAWAELSSRFGRLPLSELVEPAARYAEEGYPLAPNVARLWRASFDNFSKSLRGDEFRGWFTTFAPDGRAPGAGDIWRCPELSVSLREIGKTNAESFYRGELAERIVSFAKKTGGLLRSEDLASYRAEWVEPLSVNYRGYDVFELPPNGHGITVLMALNILKAFDLGAQRERNRAYHLMIEALKLAFTDARTYVADPRAMKADVSELLSESYAAKRRALIGDEAVDPQPGDPFCGGTVYLCAADGEGNMVSYIQSNYLGFGSGVVVPGTGVSLQNRAANFSMDPRSDNVVAPGKKSYHTIIPGFLMKDGRPVGPFGVMGGFMQPQGHLQLLTNELDFHMNPQESLDAPRFQWVGGRKIQVEKAVPIAVVRALKARGHEIEVVEDRGDMGRGEVIWRLENGVLCGASEPRCDGTVACW